MSNINVSSLTVEEANSLARELCRYFYMKASIRVENIYHPLIDTSDVLDLTVTEPIINTREKSA